MFRRGTRLLAFCISSTSAGSLKSRTETLPLASKAFFSSQLQVTARTAWLNVISTACNFHTNNSFRELDLNYRSPTEKIWPASPRQQKVASRVVRALELTFTQPTFLEALVKNYGVCVEEVRMSPDMLTAYVLWSANPGCEDAARRELQARLSKIRVSVGKALKARHVPKLEFRFNQLSASQAAVMEELDRVKDRDP